LKPVAVPAFGQAAFANTTRAEPGEKDPDPLPSVDDILDKYVRAVGGSAAIEKISTRVLKASLSRPKLVNPSGTPSMLEIYQKAPDKFLIVTTAREGVTYQGFNGKIGWIKTTTQQEGWIKTVNKQREMNRGELAQAKSQVSYYSELGLKQQYTSMKVLGREKVGEREAYMLSAVTPNNRMENLFFDTETGLLLRRTIFNQTMLGLDPFATDFSDYREVNGVKLPFVLQVSSVDNNHNSSTRKFTEIKQNIAIDDAMFEMPVAAQ
jgi:hypothetical protein